MLYEETPNPIVSLQLKVAYSIKCNHIEQCKAVTSIGCQPNPSEKRYFLFSKSKFLFLHKFAKSFLYPPYSLQEVGCTFAMELIIGAGVITPVSDTSILLKLGS